MSRDR